MPDNKSQTNFILKLMILETHLERAPFGTFILQSLGKALVDTGWRSDTFSSSVAYKFCLLHTRSYHRSQIHLEEHQLCFLKALIIGYADRFYWFRIRGQ